MSIRSAIAGCAGGLLGPVWIGVKRWEFREGRRPLSEGERAELAGYFRSELLESVSVVERPRIELVNAAVGRRLGIVQPLGLALDNRIVLQSGADRQVDWYGLIFHELVHVVQFALLGRARFLRRYLEEWANGGAAPDAISLERDAYELQARYLSASRRVFDVEAEIARRLGLRS